MGKDSRAKDVVPLEEDDDSSISGTPEGGDTNMLATTDGPLIVGEETHRTQPSMVSTSENLVSTPEVTPWATPSNEEYPPLPEQRSYPALPERALSQSRSKSLPEELRTKLKRRLP